ncbi:MAG: sensor histidine kinase [Lachnospiraceae bacterium]|jgi:two-component system sensor histidine kinase DegS|nr:sensor histidine kinase [Lachnospiraceae bacterium]MCI8874411.1 sensor histidine kinase [Lachnospiraceae bacterium]MCI9058776.1 sensor histidine kinase [Lachnospiraceae bacterium]GFI32331.1 signal transduction histidine-protein kinase/phosphatase DegS [Lachnospiraceae bacterium]
MIVDYLEKIHQEMYEKKLNLEREIQKKEILLNDNIKFIQALENSLDENFESFTPRSVNQENHLKIDALRNEQKTIESELNDLKIEITELNAHIAELNSVTKVAKENEKYLVNKKELKEKRGKYQRKFLEIQEMERQRIARELHDSIVQSLTNTIHKIEICTKIMDVDTVRCRLELHVVSKTIRDIIQEMRNIVYDLRPTSLDDIKLEKILEKEISKIRKSEILNVSYETLGESIELSPMISLSILRIVQEACNNILKHARAENVLVQVEYEKDKIIVRIEDDGVGFIINDIQNLKKEDGSGLGISMMKERVFLFAGRLEINSEPGKGTRILVEVPIDKEDA